MKAQHYKSTRQRKYELHQKFDALWDTKEERRKQYARLARFMGVTPDKAHFSNMNTHEELDNAEMSIIRLSKKNKSTPKKKKKKQEKKQIVVRTLSQEMMNKKIAEVGKRNSERIKKEKESKQLSIHQRFNRYIKSIIRRILIVRRNKN